MFSTRMRKAIAIFLLTIFVQSVIAPTVTYALTSGPTAPEFSSFEPVDTTDMVNLASGDLVYNMPLLEVPGPEGGYPISLSYHSGVLLNEEASWVGLGFTLNPGAINRTVNGNPDDHLGATRTVRDYDPGGERNKFSLGVGVPGANFGLSVSHDTNLGWGVGHNAGIEIPYKAGSAVGVNIGAQLGYDPFAGSYGYAGLSVKHAKGLTGRVGISTNFNSVSFNTGLSYKGLSGGASMSSSGVRGSVSVSGASFSQVNSNVGRVTTDGIDMEFPVIFPNGLVLTLGYNYLRYYSDESSDVKVIGSLFAKETNGKNPDEWTFDSYALLDPDLAGGIVRNSDPEKTRGGSFPAYDFYNVNAQGLNGSIQPYILENGTLFRQNVKKSGSNEYIVKYNQVNNSFNFHKPVNFRFKNDFSNSYSYDQKTVMQLENDGTIRFHNEKTTPTPEIGFDNTQNHLAGSKHIQWFTNTQVNGDIAKIHGLMNYHDYYFKSNPNARRGDAWARGANVANQIGAYMITNESGVTYHYALPVYSYDEYLKVQDLEDANKFHEESNPQPYAYTWLLTAITGSDFVDRNDNGYVDESDWGYWVRFDYGRLTDDYEWRNPGRGYRIDIDNESKIYSRGKKEIYYLNEISTRTHTAFFTKEFRVDGKSAVLPDENGGQFLPVKKTERDDRSHQLITRYFKPQSTLKLSKVFLVSNDEAIRLGLFDYRSDEQQVITHNGGRVMDLSDRCLTSQFNDKLTEISKAAIRTINFEMDYSLCDKTENSFDILFESGSTPVTDTLQYTLRGKLTLNAVEFLGHGGTNLLPKTTFSYNKNSEYKRNFHDMWGFYKSDFKSVGHENLSRYVSNTSAQDVDTWCLSRISSPLGADIEITYESDSYRLPALYKSYPFSVKNLGISADKPGIVNITFDERIKSDLGFFFSENDQIRLLAYLQNYYFDEASNQQCTGVGFDYHLEEYTVTVGKVFPDHLEVALQPLHDVIKHYRDLRQTTITMDFDSYEGPLKESCPAFFNEAIREYQGGRLACANILIDKPVGKVGGGTRVKTIKIKSNGDEFSTNYNYSLPGSDITSGTVSYEPTGLDLARFNDNGWNDEDIREFFEKYNAKKLTEAKEDFFESFHGNFSKLLAISREVPSPAVLYQFVSVSETTKKDNVVFNVPGKKVYEFQTFEEFMVNRTKNPSEAGLYPTRCLDEDGQPTDCSWTPDTKQPVECYDQNGNPIHCSVQPSLIVNPMTIKDYSAWVGAAREIATYGADDVPLAKTSYQYLHTGKTLEEFNNSLKTAYKNQGVITQLFNENKNVGKVYSRKDEYPLVPLGKTSIDYKRGLTEEVKNISFDFYTGAPTKVLTTNSYGVKYLKENVPAYTKYPGMGLKVKKPENKHMLSQATGHYTYKLNDQDQPVGLLSATIATWSSTTQLESQPSPQEGVWREKASFLWHGKADLNKDGTYKIESFTDFDYGTQAVNADWIKTSEITLYDHYSHALEAFDVNNNYSSVKFDPNKTRVIASTINGAFDETGYSGAEYSDGNTHLEGGVHRGDGNPTTIRAHTGKYSLLVPFGGKGFNYTLKGIPDPKPYRASVWLYAPGEAETQSELDKILLCYTAGGNEYKVSPKLQKNKSKSWYLLNIDIIPTDGSDIMVAVKNNSARGIYLDDFRIQPSDAIMTAFVYDPKTSELAYLIDNSNLYTHYEYDGHGRLVRTSKELLNFDYGDGKESFRADQILQETQYNYRKSHN